MTTQQLIDDLFREGVPYAESLNSRIQQVLVSMGGDSAAIAALFRDYFPYASTFNSRLRTGLELVGVSAADTADLFADGKNHTASLNERLLYAFAHAGPSISFSGTIAEGATTGRAVGTATLANPPLDIGTLTWSELGTGTGAALFAINSSTGAVTNSAALDYETATSYTYGIQVTDGVYTYTLLATINVLAVLGNLALDSYSWTPGTPASGSITGAHTNEVITLGSGWPSGLTINSAARTWAYDGTGTDSTGTGSLIGTHPQATNSPHTTSGLGWTLSTVSAPTGFYANGATNTSLKAMLAAVSGGTGRGKIVAKGDSTFVGMGAVIVSGTGDEVAQLTGARPYRPTATLAAELSANGYAALDNAFVCDGRSTPYGVSLSSYDPRISFTGADWTPNNVQSFAGGGYLNISSTSILQFVPTTSVDTFVCLLFNVGGSVAFAIDGSAPATVTAPGATVSGNVVTPPSGNTGFTKVIITAASAGTHTFGAVATAGSPLMSSVMAYNSGVKALDIVNHASVAANSGDQATENTGGVPWYNNDELGVEAPDLTIINCTVNDAGLGTATATVTANLQAIITKAKLTGDVLLVNSSPANPTFATTLAQTTLRDAVAALAVSNSVAFMDLYEYFVDWSAVASRTADGLVHPNRGMAAEIGQVYRQCIQAMAA